MSNTVAIYTFNSTIDTQPTISGASSYSYTDTNNNDGTITRTITGNTPPTSISFKSKTGLISLSYLDTSNLTSLASLFLDCINLIEVDLSSSNTSNVTSMYQMFRGCENLESINLENLNTGKVTNMGQMFWACRKLTELDVSSFDTSKVTDAGMDYMFIDCANLKKLDLSNFNVSGITTNLRALFWRCNELEELNLSNWNIRATNLYQSVASCPKLETIIMHNCSYTSVNKVIADGLPTRTEDSWGMIHVVGIDDLSQVNVSAAESKLWFVTDIGYTEEYVRARYTINQPITIAYPIPVFNEDFVFMLEDFDNGDGTYTIEIYANEDFTSCQFFNSYDAKYDAVLSVEYLKITNKVTSLNHLFNDCESLVAVNTQGWDTSNVTDMSYTFWFCPSLQEIDVSSFDMRKVTTARAMFGSTTTMSLNKIIGIENWDTSSLTDTYAMFQNCTSLTSLDLSGMDMHNVTTTTNMLYGCAALEELNVSGWNLGKATIARDLLYGSNNLKKIKMFNTDYASVNKLITGLPTKSLNNKGVLNVYGVDNFSKVSSSSASSKYWTVTQEAETVVVAQYKFNNSIYNLIPIFNSDFEYTYEDVVSGTTTTRTIYSIELPTKMLFGYDQDDSNTSASTASSLLEVLNMNISQLTRANRMFKGCSNLTKVECNWSDNTITHFTEMFQDCTSLISINLNGLVTSSATNLQGVFSKCSNLQNIDLTNWDTKNVATMNYLFDNCKALVSLDINNWDTSKITGMVNMFLNCESLTTLNVSNFNTSKVTNMLGAFRNCKNLISLDLNNFNTSEVTNMQNMFQGCTVLTNINCGNWNTDKVINMSYMFSDCSALTTLDVSNWNTSSVTNMNCMFNNCGATTLNVSNWNTGNVTNMGHMFSGCAKLTALDVSKWDTGNVTSMGYMFHYCTKLKQLDVSNWNTSKVEDMGYLFSTCNTLMALDLSKWDTSSVTYTGYMFNSCSKLTSLDLSSFNISKVTYMRYMVGQCTRLTDLDISNWTLSSTCDAINIFYNSKALQNIKINDSDYYTVNSIISLLPAKTADDPGTLDITGIDDISQVDTASAESKYWTVVRQSRPDDLVQGDITEDGTFNDENTTVVRTNYIDISNKRSIIVEVVTDNVYISSCYLYDTNKELIKTIDFSSDKKRVFGVNLQELIDQILEDEEGGK